MQYNHVMRQLFHAALIAALVPFAEVHAATQVTVQADRHELSLDESLALKFVIKSNANERITEPNFNAPGFEVINEYSGSYTQSLYENGQFTVSFTQELTKVLKPMKVGPQKITGIEINVGGKTFSAQPIDIMVRASGAGTPPPRGYYRGGGAGMRGAGKQQVARGKAFFLRAEISKQRAFKGEQIVVSYYLYTRVRMFNIMADKFPTLTGFLREDLEMPVMGNRLESEHVMLDGGQYSRSLLARYAVYPLKNGKLKIDPFSIKASYYAKSDVDDEADPFTQFFAQMAPRTGQSRSESLYVEVVPLPEQGKPSSFTGGVGDFSLTTAVDKYEVRANEAVNLTVKVEGKGNVAAIGEPKAKWPDTVELYESKGNAKTDKGGVGTKIFEFLLIPRVPGKVTLPQLELSFFDPIKGAYVTRKTDQIEIKVSDAAPGTAYVPVKRAGDNVAATGAGSSAQSEAVKPAEDVMYLKDPAEPGPAPGPMGLPWWRWMYWLSATGVLLFAFVAAVDKIFGRLRLLRSTRKSRLLAESKSWQKLKAAAKAARSGAPWNDVTHTYELLTGAVYDAIDRKHSIGARSLSRSELRRALVDEHGMSAENWMRLDRLLDFTETVRFASSAGVVSEIAAREQLSKWVDEGLAITKSRYAEKEVKSR